MEFEGDERPNAYNADKRINIRAFSEVHAGNPFRKGL
jgi:hypothetical protein